MKISSPAPALHSNAREHGCNWDSPAGQTRCLFTESFEASDADSSQSSGKPISGSEPPSTHMHLPSAKEKDCTSSGILFVTAIGPNVLATRQVTTTWYKGRLFIGAFESPYMLTDGAAGASVAEESRRAYVGSVKEMMLSIVNCKLTCEPSGVFRSWTCS